ncbi:hypothetical protein [Streptomyces cyanogenus]|uniref:Uncharacterized protein n=1 Tax=Streptomyces cyanogenus TaxID=80860 RepID=A0ABX7TX69_STRCY|nr:hypothetical protein [Streptomyces cyanogenus]QTE01202.1 hypothetical protein S1361_27990 [Streptomyces cyanogenus]
MIFLLLGVLALAIGGCVSVVWAERGGPRWVRAVALVTRTAGELLAGTRKKRGRTSNTADDGD